MKPEEAAKSIKSMKPGDRQKILSLLPGKYKRAVKNKCSVTQREDQIPAFFIFIPTKIENLPTGYEILLDATGIGDESINIETPDVGSADNIFPFPKRFKINNF